MTGLILLWSGCAIGLTLLSLGAFFLMKDDLSGGGFALALTGFMLILSCGLFGGAKTWERSQCGYASQQYQLPTRWTFWYGCYIKAGNRYVALDQYRAFINGGDKP